jgi:hypothetical protein
MKTPLQKRRAMRSVGSHHEAKFDGAREPKIESKFPVWKYGSLISTLELERFKFRVWRDFREHTGRWPVLSISFHCGLWAALVAGLVCFSNISTKHNWSGLKFWGAFALGVAVWIVVGEIGAAAMRKLDWRLFAGHRP